VTKSGLSTVGLLGTAFTMEQDFYRDRLASHGLTVLTPPAADRAEVHRIIYDELCLGKVQDESRQIYRNIITGLAEAGAGALSLVVLRSSCWSPLRTAPFLFSPLPACTSKRPSIFP
jgi:aspartate racemase